jgi:hypothetical protein
VGEAGRLIIRIDAVDADDRELDRLARQLRKEILDRTDVDEAELVTSPELAPGSKGAGLVELGQLVLQLAPAALPGLIAVLRSWISRRSDAKTRVVLKLGDRSLELEYPVGSMTHEDLRYFVSTLSGEGAGGTGGSGAKEGT